MPYRGPRAQVATDIAPRPRLIAVTLSPVTIGDPSGKRLALSLLTGEFRDPTDEEAYVGATQPEQQQRFRTVAAAAVLINTLFGAADAMTVPIALLPPLLLLRGLGMLPLILAALWRRPWRPAGMLRVHLITSLIFLASMIAVSALLPPRPVAMTIWSSIILMVYLLVPLSLRGALLCGVGTSAAVLLFVPMPWSLAAPEAIRALLILIGLNGLGALVHRALGRGRRAEFSLLWRTLPRAVIPRLQRGERVVDHVPSASILFADIVGFSARSARMPVAEVVEMLDQLFATFDELARRFGAEKIKTIGDCYMAAVGLPEPRPDHPAVIARFALAMREATATKTFAGHEIALRIGLHCGPVAAGIIGEERFLYDVWGETVNTASRMESGGQARAIVITPALKDALGDAFTYEPNPDIALKDGTRTPTWKLLGERPPAPAPAQP